MHGSFDNMIEIKDNNEVLVLSTPIGVGSKRKFELMKMTISRSDFPCLIPYHSKWDVMQNVILAVLKS